MNSQKRALLLDLDGTLVDTAPDLTRALNATLDGLNLPIVPAARVRQLVGRGARALIERGLADAGAQLDRTEIDTAVAAFLDHYEAGIADQSAPFPGVSAALRAFEAEGWRLAVCTNKPESLARKLLSALDLTPHLHAIVGGDTLSVKKPDPAPARRALAEAGGCAEAAFIGDSDVDVATARALGVGVAIASYGYHDPPAEALGADRIFDRFEDLVPDAAALCRPIAIDGEARGAL